MENNYHGDLADIFRPGSGGPPGVSDWQYFDHDHDQEPSQMNMNIQKSTRIIHDQGFGQPFTSLLSDPLIHDEQGTSIPCFFGTSLHELDEQQPATTTPLGFDDHHKIIKENHNHNHNIFSKMLQISPNAAASAKSTLSSSNNDHNIITSSCNSSSSAAVASSSKRCLMETSSTTTLQISSPRNPGIKRRCTT